MKVFVTGSTGLVGSALVPKLFAAGHTVLALARSPATFSKLEAAGATVVQGSIEDLDVVAKAASEADAVAHLAFDHQLAFTGRFPEACEKDRAVIKAICDALATKASSASGSSPIFIIASGTLGLQGSAEKDQPHKSPAMPRYLSTELAFSYADKGLRVAQIRLAPITFGGPERLHDFISMPFAKYKELGHVIYPDTGNVWSTCQVDDMADLYLKVIESTKLPNPATLHGIAESAVPHSEVAAVLGKKFGLPTKAVSAEELKQELGVASMFMLMGRPATSDWTKEVTGWQPTGEGLIALLERWNP